MLDAYQTPTIAELAPMIDGKPDFTKLKEINLEELARRFRMQRIVFLHEHLPSARVIMSGAK